MEHPPTEQHRTHEEQPRAGVAPSSGGGAHIEAEGYTVHLDSFEGPLDLLLYLIRRAEVDIHDIPIGTITEQFMQFLGQIERIDMDAAGEFLLMAATLMEIKSRSLSPVETARSSDEEGASRPTTDPRQELVAQLLEYRRARDAADALERRWAEWRGRLPGGGAVVGEAETGEDDEAIEVEDLHVMDLVEAFNTIIEAVDFNRMGDHEIFSDDTPMELHAADIVDRLERHAETDASGMRLQDLFHGRRRVEMIGLFLATLELVRNRRIAVAQDGAGSIRLVLREPETEATGPGLSEREPAGEEPSQPGVSESDG